MGTGHYGIGIWNPKLEVNIGGLWRSADIFGANFIFTIGRRYAGSTRQASDTTKSWKNIPLFHYTDMEDMLEHLPHASPLVAIELNPRSEQLNEFEHPESAVYLLGAEDHGLPPKILDYAHRIIEVPTARGICLNVATAGSIVMYDRLAKKLR